MAICFCNSACSWDLSLLCYVVGIHFQGHSFPLTECNTIDLSILLQMNKGIVTRFLLLQFVLPWTFLCRFLCKCAEVSLKYTPWRDRFHFTTECPIIFQSDFQNGYTKFCSHQHCAIILLVPCPSNSRCGQTSKFLPFRWACTFTFPWLLMRLNFFS